MKKASEICQLPVLSIQDGAGAEKFARLAVNPATRGVEYVAFAGTPWYEPPRVLPWSGVKAVGRDRITIADRKRIAQVDEGLRERLAATVDVIGAEVVDSNGCFLGKVADFAMDEATGGLMKLLLADGAAFAIDCVLTLGAQAVVVEGGAAAEAAGPFQDSGFLLGKTAAVNISDDKGNVVVPEGTAVTHREIEAARAAGALYDLVTGVR